MTEIFLVRHGCTAANQTGTVQGQTNVPLSELGIKQSGMLAGRLRNIRLDAVYSSDLDRAMTTAKLIYPALEPIPSPELREWNLGHWVGHPIREVAQLYPEEFHAFIYDAPEFLIAGGESKSQLYGRCSAFLECLVERHRGGRLLLVSHCGVLRALLKHVMGAEHSWPRQPQIGNVSLSKVVYDNGIWQLAFWNDTSHLESFSSRPDGY